MIWPRSGQVSAAAEAHGVSKSYGSHLALEDLTFALEAGELVGVLGPNGAGKTPAIRILTTILAPDRVTSRSPASRTTNRPGSAS